MPHPVASRSTSTWAWRIIGRLAFNRIAVVGQEHLPSSGAVLFVATHRNGALDGAPYTYAVPDAVPMVSVQLHRTWLGRFLFRGIPVARAKDRDRGMAVDNLEGVERCIALLAGGGRLLVMPEGTSALGFNHLPFQRGAARIAHAALNAGVELAVVPLGVHYEDPTMWQSRVEVLIGEPIRLQRSEEVPAIHRLITQGLESVGANFTDGNAQCHAEILAYAATLGTRASYARSLKRFEQISSETLDEIVSPLERIAENEGLCLHQGVPLIPVGPRPLYALYWLVLAPIAAGFFLLNLPALAAGFIASRKLPDAPNVVAFWRMVAGLPAGLVWGTAASIGFGLTHGLAGLVFYWGVTLAGIGAWYRFRKLTIALCNGLLHAGVRPALLQAFEKLKELLRDRTV